MRRIILLTLPGRLTNPRLRTLRVSSAGNWKPGTKEKLGWLSSAFAATIADSETEDGESGIVLIEPRRGRLPPPSADGPMDLPRAWEMSMEGIAVCEVKRGAGGGPIDSSVTVGLLGMVVVTLVTGDTVTWAGAAVDGRQFCFPGTSVLRDCNVLEICELIDGVWDEDADAWPDDCWDARCEPDGTGSDTAPGVVGDGRDEVDGSPRDGIAIESWDDNSEPRLLGPRPLEVVISDGGLLGPCEPCCEC